MHRKKGDDYELFLWEFQNFKISSKIEKKGKYQKIKFTVSPKSELQFDGKIKNELKEEYLAKINSKIAIKREQLTKEDNSVREKLDSLYRWFKSFGDLFDKDVKLDLLDNFNKRVVQTSDEKSDIAFTRIDIDSDISTFFVVKNKNDKIDKEWADLHFINVQYAEHMISHKLTEFTQGLSHFALLMSWIIPIISSTTFLGVVFGNPAENHLINWMSDPKYSEFLEDPWLIVTNICQLVALPASAVTRRIIGRKALGVFFRREE